jgi:hypothetical protein
MWMWLSDYEYEQEIHRSAWRKSGLRCLFLRKVSWYYRRGCCGPLLKEHQDVLLLLLCPLNGPICNAKKNSIAL